MLQNERITLMLCNSPYLLNEKNLHLDLRDLYLLSAEGKLFLGFSTARTSVLKCLLYEDSLVECRESGGKTPFVFKPSRLQ